MAATPNESSSATNGGHSRAKRPTKAELERRITEIMRMIASGTARASLLAYARKTWNLETRAADNLIRNLLSTGHWKPRMKNGRNSSLLAGRTIQNPRKLSKAR